MDTSRISISVNTLEEAEIRAAAMLQLLCPTTWVHRVALDEARRRLGRGQSADPSVQSVAMEV